MSLYVSIYVYTSTNSTRSLLKDVSLYLNGGREVRENSVVATEMPQCLTLSQVAHFRVTNIEYHLNVVRMVWCYLREWGRYCKKIQAYNGKLCRKRNFVVSKKCTKSFEVEESCTNRKLELFVIG